VSSEEDGQVSREYDDAEITSVHSKDDDSSDAESAVYCMVPALNAGDVNKSDGKGNALEEKRELGRLPMLAIFHKMAYEKGVPYSFVSEYSAFGSAEKGCLTFPRTGFIRQWPALPRVVVGLMI